MSATFLFVFSSFLLPGLPSSSLQVFSPIKVSESELMEIKSDHPSVVTPVSSLSFFCLSQYNNNNNKLYLYSTLQARMQFKVLYIQIKTEKKKEKKCLKDLKVYVVDNGHPLSH